jgi:hypothetical protein
VLLGDVIGEAAPGVATGEVGFGEAGLDPSGSGNTLPLITRTLVEGFALLVRVTVLINGPTLSVA